MCGIVGLFLKDPSLEPQLGSLLTDMLITMTDRGPDSAGIAIYGTDDPALSKLTVQSDTPDRAFATLERDLSAALGGSASLRLKDTHAVLEVPRQQLAAARAARASIAPDIRVMSSGDTVEIYKEVRPARDGGDAWHWSHPNGDGVRCDDPWRAPVQHRPRPMPCP
mgnify:CR=1 FL=1